MQLPKQISPCPIIEAIVELRFASAPKVPADAIFGLAFEKLNKIYPTVTNLPVLQVPEQIRQADPNLRYQAHHRFAQENFSFSLGPRVLIFSCSSPYIGWEAFFAKIQENLKLLLGIEGMIEHFERLGVRFINFFDGTTSVNIALNISANNLPLADVQFHSTFVYPEENFTTIIQIGNKVDVAIGSETKKGSVVDIDTFKQSTSEEIKTDLFGFIDRAHLSEKNIFFSLLKKEILDRLNPVY